MKANDERNDELKAAVVCLWRPSCQSRSICANNYCCPRDLIANADANKIAMESGCEGKVTSIAGDDWLKCVLLALLCE